MIDKTVDAERWNRAIHVARGDAVSAIKLRLNSELSVIKREERLLYLRLFWCQFKRVLRRVFVYYPQMLRWQCRKLLINLELLGIECLLAFHNVYDRFSRHIEPPAVNGSETPNVKVTGDLRSERAQRADAARCPC